VQGQVSQLPDSSGLARAYRLGMNSEAIRNAEFNDPRLVPIYDSWCPWGLPDDFFMALAGETPQARVLDFGCGTGRLAIALAAAGHRVTGVDPASNSLEAARAKPGADRVTWLEGSHEILPSAAFDLIVMNSHVAQFLVTDLEWTQALTKFRQALVPGGRLAFDSRDPNARGWEAWNPIDSREQLVLPDGRTVEIWTEVVDLTGDNVTFLIHYQFSDSSEELLSRSTLRFRSEHELRSSLQNAGFEVEQIFGGWNRDPIGHKDGEFVVVARAGSSRSEKVKR
jgi:ubiquinone/menaquinone biosynthesis C-methylase UbiE